MNALIRIILSDRILKICTITSLVCIVLMCLYIALVYTRLPPFLPIYNQLPWGSERIGQSIAIFFPIVLTAAIFLCNLFVYRFFYTTMPLVTRMVAITTLFSSIVTGIFIAQISFLVI